MAYEFDPVKEDTDGVIARRAIWSTKAVDKAIKGLEQGKKLAANPFYNYNIKLLKHDLVFERTPEETEEFKKCMGDVLYFANNYAKLMTPAGRKNVTMRDYQQGYLKHLQEHQLTIYLSCRQSGKCVKFLTLLEISSKCEKFIDAMVNNYHIKNYFINENGNIMVPIFEIYNLADRSISWRIKYKLYSKLWQLTRRKSKQSSKQNTLSGVLKNLKEKLQRFVRKAIIKR